VLHNLAQASHSHAQGKVGSGFDIASAVFGSCLYKRFSSSLLSKLASPSTPSFATQLRSLIEGPSWDTEIQKSSIKMPKGLRLVMCDVDCGSETPGMVKKVLAWRAEKSEEAEKNWKSLQEGNEMLARELTRLATEGEGKYDKLRHIILSNRALIREMGEKSGVPIEPPQQTRLLDYCSKLDGVVGGVVPGAGGFDAIVLLVEDKEETLEALKEAVASYQDPGALGRVGVIGVREEMIGVKKEELSLYKEWEEAL
jgi:phosphomevalonate kinase